jgi:hypothetical protein
MSASRSRSGRRLECCADAAVAKRGRTARQNRSLMHPNAISARSSLSTERGIAVDGYRSESVEESAARPSASRARREIAHRLELTSFGSLARKKEPADSLHSLHFARFLTLRLRRARRWHRYDQYDRLVM